MHMLVHGSKGRFERWLHSQAHGSDNAHVGVLQDTVERQWGLKLVPLSRKAAAHSMTAIYYPEGMAPAQLLPKVWCIRAALLRLLSAAM